MARRDSWLRNIAGSVVLQLVLGSRVKQARTSCSRKANCCTQSFSAAHVFGKPRLSHPASQPERVVSGLKVLLRISRSMAL